MKKALRFSESHRLSRPNGVGFALPLQGAYDECTLVMKFSAKRGHSVPEERDTLKALQNYGGVFKWGSGLLGKSAIVVGPVVALILVGIWSLHSDWMKIGAMLLASFVFFGWYLPFLRFCEKHPASALLEGVQWAEHQQFLAGKGRSPIALKDAGQPYAGLGAPSEDEKNA